jgi:activator of HSP90 ATPase
MKKQETTGVGSIWNNNNWFYEEKNYTKFAKEYLTEELCKIVFKKNDTEVKFYEIKELKGEASITIRKQKQIFLFDIEAEIYFEACKISDPNVNCKGKVKVMEVNQDDDEITMEVTQEKPGDFVAAVRRLIQNDMQEITLNTILGLSKAMKARDSDEAKVKQDQMKREEAKKAVEEAKTQTGEEKQRIFDEAK